MDSKYFQCSNNLLTFEIVTNTLVISRVPDPDINVAISFLISSMFKSGKSFFFCKCRAKIKVIQEQNLEYKELRTAKSGQP